MFYDLEYVIVFLFNSYVKFTIFKAVIIDNNHGKHYIGSLI